MKVAIVEDDKRYRETLASYLKQYETEKKVRLEVKAFSDGADLMINFKPIYDIIFLDIEMPHSNGMAVAKQIREVDQDAVLIFITNMMQYAIDGYEVEALDYILKPIPYFQFSFKLDKAVSIVSRRSARSISFTSGGRKYRISPDQIYYIEVIAHCMILHTADGNYEVWHRTLKEMDALLSPHGFALCNVSILVNLRYVRSVAGDMVTVGTDPLPISRGKRKTFLAALSEYMG